MIVLLAALIPAAQAQDQPQAVSGSFKPVSDVIGQPRIKLQSGDIRFLYVQAALAAAPPASLAAAPQTSPAGKQYLLVQFDAPIAPDDRAALVSAGATVYEYIPDFTFLVGVNPDAVPLLNKLPHLLGHTPYLPAFKIQPDLYARHIAPLDLGGAALQKAGKSSDITIVGFKGESLGSFLAWLKGIGATVIDSGEDADKFKVRATVPGAKMADVAANPVVRWMELTPEWKLFNNLTADGTECNVRNVWDNRSLFGSGQIVCVADSGLDRGFTSGASLLDDFKDGGAGTHVIAILDTAGDGDVSDNDAHGTHVAGSVLGNGALSGSTPSTHTYPPTCFAGMAPEAQLVFQAIMNNMTGGLVIPADLNMLFDQARAAYNASVHTNSWGSAQYGSYDSYAYDVDQNIWANKNFNICFAAGNEGTDANRDGLTDLYSISSPATAKDCITVGASENLRPSGVGFDGTYGSAWPQDYFAPPDH